MKVTVERNTPWSLAYSRALETMGYPTTSVEPSSGWKRKMLLARHSPIRCVMYTIRMEDIPYWVSVHFVRHGKFAEHFVSTQRPDRTHSGVSRHDLPQDASVNHTIFTNAAELIEISKKRLCALASSETRTVWRMVVAELRRIGETEMADAMVPECVHHGNRCPEFRGCGACPPVGAEDEG